MTATLAMELVRRAVMLALLVAGPVLLVALVVGLVISLVQAVTQLQEQTLTFIPKLVAVGIVIVLAMPWMLRLLIEHLVETLRSLPTLVT